MFVFATAVLVLFWSVLSSLRRRRRPAKKVRRPIRNPMQNLLRNRRRRHDLGARPVQPVQPYANLRAEHDYHRSVLTTSFPRALYELAAYASRGHLPDGASFLTPPKERPAPCHLAPFYRTVQRTNSTPHSRISARRGIRVTLLWKRAPRIGLKALCCRTRCG